MKVTKKEIKKSYSQFINRNYEEYGLPDWDKIPLAFYDHLEVIE